LSDLFFSWSGRKCYEQYRKSFSHNLWTICHVIEEIRFALDNDTLEKMISDILEKHQLIFPGSMLKSSLLNYGLIKLIEKIRTMVLLLLM